MKVIILSGIPGSGKTTFRKEAYKTAQVYSADDYFRQACPKCQFEPGMNEVSCDRCNGTLEIYAYDKSKQAAAHQRCLRNFTQAITWPATRQEREGRVIVVDNTNTTALEIAPYARLAEAFNIEFNIITFECSVALALTRQTHGVPEEVIKRMHSQLQARILPSSWNQQTITIS